MDNANRRELRCMGTHPCYPYEYTDGGWGNNTRIREVDKDIYNEYAQFRSRTGRIIVVVKIGIVMVRRLDVGMGIGIGSLYGDWTWKMNGICNWNWK